MIDESTGRRTPQKPDSMDLTAQTRSLRRKLVFWRRTAWLLLGTIAVLFAVVLNRSQSHQHECWQALNYFAETATKKKLGEQDPAILEHQWQAIGMGPAHIYLPEHYDLIVKNWRRNPMPGERLPLAVCRMPHLALMGEYRHVLYKDEKGLHIEWMPDVKAQPILQEAARDNREP